MAATISSLMASTDGGDRSAADALFAALYAELHELARRQLSGVGSGVTLGATTCQLARGRALQGLGKNGEARAAFSAAFQSLEPSQGADHPETREARRLANAPL